MNTTQKCIARRIKLAREAYLANPTKATLADYTYWIEKGGA